LNGQDGAVRWLDTDEQVVMDLHPHAKRLFWPFVRVPVIAGLSAFGATAVPSGDWQRPARWAILAIAAILLVGWSLRPWLVWQATRIVLTNRRLVVRTGVLTRRGRDVLLSRINDVSFTRSLSDRLFGCGTLVVESAGERGQLVLDDVPHVERLQLALHARMEADAADLRRSDA
jgi:uncharacterized membrane protein YdbT with pleckstrin-like domain